MRAVSLVVVAALALSGCALRPPPAATKTVQPAVAVAVISQRLVGQWVMAGWDYSMSFAVDGTLVRNIEGQDTSGTFTISPDGQRLILAYTDGTTLNTRFVLNDDALVLRMDDPNSGAKEPITLMRSRG